METRIKRLSLKGPSEALFVLRDLLGGGKKGGGEPASGSGQGGQACSPITIHPH